MTRRHLTFACEGATLVGTLDEAGGNTGLLIVSGGNEIRAGAWAGQSWLAARVAGAGHPVFRFDRRGVGDSEGANGTFRESGPDIAAALGAFRAACPHVRRVVGLGNCDAASALMLTGGAGLDGLILANPWTIEDESAPPPPSVIWDHYRRRLRDRSAIKRLLTGKVSLRKLFLSLLSAVEPGIESTGLTRELAAGVARFKGQTIFLLAERDRTAQAFIAAWNRDDPRIRVCRDATHSFVEPHARAWLTDRALEMLRD